MKILLSIIRSILFVVNLICIFSFLISCLAPYISPEIFWPVAFAGFGFIPLLLINIGWIFFWLFFRARLSLFSLGAILLSWWNISNHFHFSGCGSNPKQGAFSVMTFNVKVFNLYDWTHNKNSMENILQVIANANPDVLCLQEFYTDDSEESNAIALLKKDYPYFYFHKTLTLRTYNHWGVATFSKFPIINTDSILFKDVQHNLAIISDIVVGSDTIRVYNAHLQSIYLEKEDYESMRHLQKKTEVKFLFLSVFSKMYKAFIKRASQADFLTREVSRSPYSNLICADFNDTPNSYTYRTITNRFSDSFKVAGCGIGRTYSQPAIFRIDYILGDKGINFISHKVIWNFESDHYAVKATFNLE